MSDRIAVVFGTRPEIIKLAPLVHTLGPRALLVHTGQHFDHEMSAEFLHQLHLGEPHLHLSVGGSTRGAQIGRGTEAIESWVLSERPAAVVVQGDTNSGLAGGLAANAAGVPLVHLEAGLRSYDRAMPEEHNRVLIDALSDLCCAPHPSNLDALEREGVSADRVRVTGSTLREALDMILPPEPERREFVVETYGVAPSEFALATIHRVENTDDEKNLRTILTALTELPVPVVFPLHPRTRAAAERFGLTGLLDQLVVCKPVGYREFVSLASESAFVVSDSGGVQEEATIIKRPVIVVRNSTERPELLGTFAHLVRPGDINPSADELMRDLPAVHQRLEALPYPYGDHVSARIAGAIDELLG